MSVICFLLAAIVLVAFTGAGFLAAHSISASQMTLSLLQLTPTSVYVVAVGACLALGLLICVSFVMLGLIYRKVSNVSAWCDRRSKRKRRSSDDGYEE